MRSDLVPIGISNHCFAMLGATIACNGEYATGALYYVPHLESGGGGGQSSHVCIPMVYYMQAGNRGSRRNVYVLGSLLMTCDWGLLKK